MKTSYFAKSSGDKNAISIALKAPKFWEGPTYYPLQPKPFMVYDKNLSTQDYCTHYNRILSKLNPRVVADEIGDDATLLCWEKPDDFCHRHLVAEWLAKALDLEIPEVADIEPTEKYVKPQMTLDSFF